MAPLHDFVCPRCGGFFERVTRDVENEVCFSCEVKLQWLPKVNVEVFKSFWHPNLDHQPVEITSMRQLDRELTKRGFSIAERRRRDTRYEHLPQSKEEAEHG